MELRPKVLENWTCGQKSWNESQKISWQATNVVPCSLKPTDEYEIVEIIAELNSLKSPGHLDIPVVLLKKAKFLIAQYLADSFNECVVTGIYPDVLKIAQVIPLHKSGSKLDLSNYRPMSILSPIN